MKLFFQKTFKFFCFCQVLKLNSFLLKFFITWAKSCFSTILSNQYFSVKVWFPQPSLWRGGIKPPFSGERKLQEGCPLSRRLAWARGNLRGFSIAKREVLLSNPALKKPGFSKKPGFCVLGNYTRSQYIENDHLTTIKTVIFIRRYPSLQLPE